MQDGRPDLKAGLRYISLLRNKCPVNGQWARTDPDSGTPFTTCPATDVSDVDGCVESSQAAFEISREMHPRQRAKRLLTWHHHFEENKRDIAKIVVCESGKPLAEAIVGEAEGIRASVVQLYVSNCRVLTPLSIITLVELAQRAALADGVLNVLTTDLRDALYVLEKITLVLSSNYPFLVFGDGDSITALDVLMVFRWRPADQVCRQANGTYVQNGVLEKLEEMLLYAVSKIRVGHGSQSGTTMGRRVFKTGGRPPPALPKGNFFESTVISVITSDILAFKEEIFGPLLCFYCFKTEDEAVNNANATSMDRASYF
ncbi:succinate-semialdehyde dehydrogenase mitochondrial precursor [Boeremia exigua]|uniref:succinate-semialdehyde dehydrogenase mitochondrial precursor n=1 Tax=Boeremia exigua TaxID=749465 RepID=UPI001E8E4852|nr:succinate-semialdehyde dehydrogenase mitochondrial precursor [Boeremia exigua]KAH6639894.1 succinate-semialdehyde dehydrogenase mitochondrial precursor [Boeremia exigua]